MRIKYAIFGVFVLFLSAFTSCTISKHSMETPNYHIEFYKSDFEYSGQLQAEATSVRVFGIDWKRLFKWNTGSFDTNENSGSGEGIAINGSLLVDPVIGGISTVIPVLGDYDKGKVSGYALYQLMEQNPGYDIVIYPRFKKRKFVIPLIYSKRTVEVTARLAKIK